MSSQIAGPYNGSIGKTIALARKGKIRSRSGRRSSKPGMRKSGAVATMNMLGGEQ